MLITFGSQHFFMELQNKIRRDFPILRRKVYNKPLVYLDNAATTQKPQIVIDTISDCYANNNSNIHRGIHFLSEQLTEQYEESREKIANFVNALNTSEIIFTKGTTESVNLVAFSFGEAFIKEGDEIIVSEMEHHSNMVPWQLLCERKNAKLIKWPITTSGALNMDVLPEIISDKTKLISVAHVSNALGTINPIKDIVNIAHARNIPVFVDGAQAVQHIPVDVQDLDVDFYAFSGHKIYGPTGIGVLYGKEKWLSKMPPYQGGGEMISKVSFKKTTFNQLPFKFEAGTPNYVGAIGLAEAIKYVLNIGLDKIAAIENELLVYATKKLEKIEGLEIVGTVNNKSSVISFNVKNIHHSDIGTLLDKLGIAVRTGSHCAEPVMDFFGITGTVRASFAFYNTKAEIDVLVNGLERVLSMLR
jgi:cysteine desulfurase/selenocysteine lyase